MKFNDKTLLITGGTGSFGNAVLNKFLDSDILEVRILSRDEKKQHDMRVTYNNPKIKFFIGDVRDKPSIVPAIKCVDYIFHNGFSGLGRFLKAGCEVRSFLFRVLGCVGYIGLF